MIAGDAILAQKGVNTNNMKYLAILALVAIGLSLGACANKDHSASSTSTQSAYSSGYSK
jgi:hypothetical protein